MDNISRRFSDKYRSHWVKVKFYKEEPKDDNAKRLKDVSFCKATREAILQPVLLDKESINCPGALYALGWEDDYKSEDGLLDCCQDKRGAGKDVLKSMLLRIRHLKKPFKYIGLNTEGVPDLIMSYIAPEEAMNLVKLHNNHQGRELDVTLCSMMSICGGVAVKTFQDGKMSFSFGCDDSRKNAEIGRDRLAVGIPRKLFDVFTT